MTNSFLVYILGNIRLKAQKHLFNNV